MKILSVEINNVLSIEQMKIEFEDSGLILVDGWNYDDNTANGAGKTSIFNALSFGLWGKIPRKISASEILRDGTKSGFVTVVVKAGDEIIEVTRSRPNNLTFKVDNTDVSMTQEEFENKTRLSYSQFLISMYSAQTEGMKLISMNDTSKKDFFLQLMNLDKFSDAKKSIDQRLKDINASVVKAKREEAELISKIEAYSDSIVDVEDLKKKNKDLDVAPLVKKYKELQAVSKPDVSKYDDLEGKLEAYIDQLSSSEIELRHKKSSYSNLKEEIALLSDLDLDNNVSCPSCSAELVLSAGGPKTIDTVKKEHETKLAEKKKKLSSLVQEINSYPSISSEKEKVKEKIQKCRLKRHQELQNYNKVVQDASELKMKIAHNRQVIEMNNEAILKNDELIIKRKRAKESLLNIGGVLKELEEERQVAEAVSTMFGPTGAPAYIMDSAIEVFNDRISSYVSDIWPNASYSLQSFKENKSGDIKAKFSEKLIINGREKSTGSLSGGEYRCLSIALDFAVIDVLETMFGINLNPIIMDEPFNDLDTSNRERVIELLEKLSNKKQIWIIDHASEAKAMFSNVIKVEKRGGISRLA